MMAPPNKKLATSAVLLLSLALVLGGADARELAQMPASATCNQGRDAAGAIFRFTCDGTKSGFQGVSKCDGTMVCYGAADTSCTGTPKDECPILPDVPASGSNGSSGGGGGGNGVGIPYKGVAQKASATCNQGKDSAGMIYRFTCDGTKSGSQGLSTCDGAMVCYRSFDTSCSKKPMTCPGTSGRRA